MTTLEKLESVLRANPDGVFTAAYFADEKLFDLDLDVDGGRRMLEGQGPTLEAAIVDLLANMGAP